MLAIRDLHARVEGVEIIKGLDLEIAAGEVHALMGPNGSGKSSLAYALAGRDGYEVTAGVAALDGQNLLEMEPEERATAGFFLAFQYPVEIAGVSNTTLLREAVAALRKARGQEPLAPIAFMKMLRARAREIGVSEDLLKRPVNAGFSGGEKKRNEILQLAVLEPRFCLLDETDSGLDVDALREVAGGINALRDRARGMLLITHYQRLLDYVIPERIHVMVDGRIERSGGAELAKQLEKDGYAPYRAHDGAAPAGNSEA